MDNVCTYKSQKIKDIRRMVQVARGEEPADLVLKNGEVFNVFTGEFLNRDIAIVDGYVAGVAEGYHGIEEIDLEGRYVTPGFIDTHIHIESSMLTPAEFVKVAIPNGTTTIIADPHEIANVSGADGIKYMLDATENVPLNVFFMLPSCVPSTPMENSGAVLLADDLEPFLKHPRVLGLGEVMNFSGVLDLDPVVHEKLEMAQDYKIDGHAPGLKGKDIMAYAAAGISSDHECATAEMARERLRAGMQVLIREGTACKNLKALIQVIDNDTAPFCSFAVDDKLPADLIKNDYINGMVRKSIEGGVSVATALQIATIFAARNYGLYDIGAIAPNYRADIIVFDNLQEWEPTMVFKDGKLAMDVKKNEGKILLPVEKVSAESVKNSMYLGEVTVDRLRLPIKGDMAYVIGLIPYQIKTNKFKLPITKKDGCAVSDPTKDILKLAIWERHHATGNVGVGLVKGFGLKEGAMASTVAHDSHNLIVIGANDEDMVKAVQELSKMGGGMVVVKDGKVLVSLELPIAGLMTDAPAEDIAQKQAELRATCHSLGVHKYFAPFLTLAFQSLAVIPQIRLTDQGLVDVTLNDIIDIEVDEAEEEFLRQNHI